MTGIVWLVCFCCPAGSSEALLSAYRQQPKLTCKALELVIRLKRDITEPKATCRARLRALSFASHVLRLRSTAAAANHAEAQQVRQLFGMAVSCLKQVSVVPSRNNRKLTAASLELAAAAAAAAAALGGAAAAEQQPGQSVGSDTITTRDAASSSSSSAAGTPSAGVKGEAGCMGLVLVARGLLAAGQHMSSINEAVNTGDSGAGTAAAEATAPRSPRDSEPSSCSLDSGDNSASLSSGDGEAGEPEAAAAAATDSNSAAELTAALEDHLKGFNKRVRWLGHVLPAIELPGGPGSEQACAAARQQLLQLQGRLQQGVQDAVVNLDSSSGSSDGIDVSSSGSDEAAAAAKASELPPAVAAALPGLAQQMVALGEALCAQLPLPHCCNNPGCVELRGASELQLVGGKGCVCSRCR
jgi:hypothetical protein